MSLFHYSTFLFCVCIRSRKSSFPAATTSSRDGACPGQVIRVCLAFDVRGANAIAANIPARNVKGAAMSGCTQPEDFKCPTIQKNQNSGPCGWRSQGCVPSVWTQTNMMLIIKGSTGSTKGCGYKTKSSLAQQSLVVVLRSIGARLTQTFQAEW